MITSASRTGSSSKFEPAARRWLVRYLSEGTPSLRDVAKVTASLLRQGRRLGADVDAERAVSWPPAPALGD
jgi:hypothetical protein